MSLFPRIMIVFLAVLAFAPCRAEDTVRIAVASNFKSTLEALTAEYSKKRLTKFVITAGATGMLYAQIRVGAPVDVFFSADWERPDQLERDGAIVEGTRFTYAFGRLVLWTPRRPIAGDLNQTLRTANIRTVAIANPKTAPYGAAAQKVLKGSTLASRFKIVQGENIGQTFQFAVTGNADAAFIALAQLREYERGNGKSLIAETLVVDPSLYTPIEQQAVLLAKAKDSAAARAFLEYVKSEEAQRLITAAGYRSLTWLPPGCHGCEKPKEAPKKLSR
jgi:molybdate transport system substrate-binding protein